MDAEGAGPPRSSHRTVVRRLVVYGVVLGTVVLAALLTGSLPTPEEVRDWGEGLGSLAPLAFVPLFVAANFLIAWPILAGAAGLLFGTAVGTVLALAGVTAASVA